MGEPRDPSPRAVLPLSSGREGLGEAAWEGSPGSVEGWDADSSVGRAPSFRRRGMGEMWARKGSLPWARPTSGRFPFSLPSHHNHAAEARAPSFQRGHVTQDRLPFVFLREYGALKSSQRLLCVFHPTVFHFSS